MASVAALYTPEVLGLAVSLADYRLDDGLPLRGHARSTSCGSTLEVGLALDANGRIARIGLAAQACAVGQAAAAIMAAQAIGKSAQDFAQVLAELTRWLSDEGAAPAWPGLDSISPARAYPARHGAILLGWRAVNAAFTTA
jgi:NifU-like protein involved in Fe-S cluster formation